MQPDGRRVATVSSESGDRRGTALALVLLVGLAGVLRFWDLGEAPPRRVVHRDGRPAPVGSLFDYLRPARLASPLDLPPKAPRARRERVLVPSALRDSLARRSGVVRVVDAGTRPLRVDRDHIDGGERVRSRARPRSAHVRRARAARCRDRRARVRLARDISLLARPRARRPRVRRARHARLDVPPCRRTPRAPRSSYRPGSLAVARRDRARSRRLGRRVGPEFHGAGARRALVVDPTDDRVASRDRSRARDQLRACARHCSRDRDDCRRRDDLEPRRAMLARWLACAALPIAIAAVAGRFEPVVLDRTFTLMAWAPCLALACLIDTLASARRVLGVVALVGILVVMVPSTLHKIEMPSGPDRPLRQLARDVEPGDIVAVRPASKAPEIAWSLGVREHLAARRVAVPDVPHAFGIELGTGQASGRCGCSTGAGSNAGRVRRRPVRTPLGQGHPHIRCLRGRPKPDVTGGAARCRSALRQGRGRRSSVSASRWGRPGTSPPPGPGDPEPSAAGGVRCAAAVRPSTFRAKALGMIGSQ